MDSTTLDILLVGDYTVNGLNYGFQPRMPRVTVKYIPYGKLDQLIELADSYLDEKYDALIIVPFNWEFLNLTSLMPDEKAPKVPQVNANVSFDKLIQQAKEATNKWTEQFRHLKVIWGLPYPIDFCSYYARIVTEYGSTWNPTPEINNAILYITKKFYSYILQLEEYVHKAKPPLNQICLRNCFFLKEPILECSFRQGDNPKFPPFCLRENGIDPSDTLCQRFKYVVVDKLKELDVKPSLAYRRRRIRMQKQKRRLQRTQGDNGQDIDDSLIMDFKTNVDESLQPGKQSSSLHSQQEGLSYPDFHPLNMGGEVLQQQANMQQPMEINMVQHPRNMPIINSIENIQKSSMQPQTPLNQAHLPLQEMHLHQNRPQGSWDPSFEQPIKLHRPEFPIDRNDISPQSIVNLLRADIPPPPPPKPHQTDMPLLSRDMIRSDVSSFPRDIMHTPELLPQTSNLQRSQVIPQPISHHQSPVPQSINTGLPDSYQSGNMQQYKNYPPAFQQQQPQQQYQMQQFRVSQPTYMSHHEMSNPSLVQQEYPPHTQCESPNYIHQQAHRQQEPVQQLDITQAMYMQKQSEPGTLHPNLNTGMVSSPLLNQNVLPNNLSESQQPTISSSKDLLITGSMLDTLKEALNYLKTGKSEETVKSSNSGVSLSETILAENEKEELSNNSPFRILDIKESSYSCKLSLFFQQSRWKDLFLKGNKAVAMDAIFSAVKAMIMLKPGRGVKIIMITTSESFINEVEKSLKPIVETCLIGVNNDIPFGTPIALIDSPTNLRLRLAQSRFRDASELGALIVFGDDLIYNIQSPASIELTHLVKLIYNKAPAEFVHKVVISEAGNEDYEDVASHILGTRFSTKREKKRSQPKDDGLSLFEMLAEELEKEEAEELMKKEATKQKELKALQQKIVEEEEKQKQLMQKLVGVSPISSHNSLPASPISDTSLPEIDDEAAFAKFLECLGPSVEKEYMEMGKKILIAHEKQYKNFVEVPVYHPDFRVKRDSFTYTYKKKFGINYKQEPFESSWRTFWKNYVTELKEEEWNKKMTKLQEKFRIKYGNGTRKKNLNLTSNSLPQSGITKNQMNVDSHNNEKSLADMVDAMLGKKKGIASLDDEKSVEDIINAMLGKKSSVEIMDKDKSCKLSSLVSSGVEGDVIREKLTNSKITQDAEIPKSDNIVNLLLSDEVKDVDKENVKIVKKKGTSCKLPETESCKAVATETLIDNEKNINADQRKDKVPMDKEMNDKTDKEMDKANKEIKNTKVISLNRKPVLEETDQISENLKDSGPKNLKAKMKEFEKKKYAEIAKDEDFVSLIFDAQNPTEKVTEPLAVNKKPSPVFDMFQEDDKVIQETKGNTATSKLTSIQQQLNKLKSDKKIPTIVPMKFIPGKLSKNLGKVDDLTSNSNVVTAKEDKIPLFKPANFIEVLPVEKSHEKLEKVSSLSKPAESKVQTAKSLSTTFSWKPAGAVSELLKPSDEKALSSVGTEDSIEEIMKSIGSGRHFKGANEQKSSSLKQTVHSRERSRSPTGKVSKGVSAPGDQLSLYLKEKEKLSKGNKMLDRDFKNRSSSQDHLALYLKECEKLSGDKDAANVNKNSSSEETLQLYLKEKQFSNKGKLGESKNVSSKETLELYLKAKEEDLTEKSNKATLDLYLKEKHSIDTPSATKATNLFPSPTDALELYLKEKQSTDTLSATKTKNILPSPTAALDLYLKEKHSTDTLSDTKAKNVFPSPTTALDMYLKEKHSIDTLNVAKDKNILPSSKATLNLYLNEKQSIKKGNEDKGNNVGSGSKAALDLYLKEKQSVEKSDKTSNSKDALELYLKEKQSMEKGNLSKSNIGGSGSNEAFDLYLKAKQPTDKEKGSKSSSANDALELYLKEKDALNKRKVDVVPGRGLKSGNPLDMYLQEKSKQAFLKGKQDEISSSKEQLELYLKEKMSSDKGKRPLQSLHDKNSSNKKAKIDPYETAKTLTDPFKNKQDIFTLENTLNLLESVCGVMGMMGHALKAIISKAKESLPDYNMALKVFTEEDSIALVNYAIKKMITLSNGSETHKYSEIVKLASSLLVKAKSSPSTSVDVMSESSKVSRNFPVDVTSIAKATIGKDSAQTYQFIKTTYLYKGLPEPSTNELEEVFKAVSKLHFTLTFKS